MKGNLHTIYKIANKLNKWFDVSSINPYSVSVNDKNGKAKFIVYRDKISWISAENKLSILQNIIINKLRRTLLG